MKKKIIGLVQKIQLESFNTNFGNWLTSKRSMVVLCMNVLVQKKSSVNEKIKIKELVQKMQLDAVFNLDI